VVLLDASVEIADLARELAEHARARLAAAA
jgi:hypothetical protein